MPGQSSKAHQVTKLGLSPAEARAQMKASSGADASPPTQGEEVKGLLNPRHIAAISQEIEGFGGDAVDGTVEEAPDQIEPPNPTKAMEMIRELSQQRLQANAERDAALGLVERYRSLYGDLD